MTLSVRKLLLGLAVGAGLVALVVNLSRPSVAGDGIGYYAPLASVVLDHNLDLRNEFAYSSKSIRQRWLTLPDGRLVDPYPVGAAILWAPVVVVAWIFDPHRDTYGLPDHWQNSSPGFSRRYVNAVAIGTAMEALGAAVLLFWCFRRRAGLGAGAAALGVAAATLGTPLVYYALTMPSYAHVASFLACSALLAAVLAGGTGRRSLLVLGLLWGLVSLVRNQDVFLGILVAPRLWRELRGAGHGSKRETALRLALFGAAAIVVFLPQALFWQRIYGSLLPQTVPSGFMHWTRPQVLAFLFSTWQGALLWSPIIGIGIIGLRWIEDRPLRAALWAAVGLEIYASAAAGDWWGSASCGARRLVVVAPILGLGVALAIDRGLVPERFRRLRMSRLARTAIVLVLTAWNLRLTQYYAADLLPKNTGNPGDYLRGYAPSDPHAQPWGLWDYRRFTSDVVDAEKRLWR